MGWTLPRRYVIIGLCFFCILINYADRTNISVAIVPMEEVFGYSETLKGTILSSFFYGYLGTQIIGGYLADRFGGKYVLAVGCLLWSLTTSLTPRFATWGIGPLIFCRILLGLAEGVSFPCCHSIIARWVPPSEKSTAVGILTSASYLGAILALSISPAIAEAPLLGWPWIFYAFAFIGYAWLVPWHIFASSTPEESWFISSEEANFIRTEIDAEKQKVHYLNIEKEEKLDDEIEVALESREKTISDVRVYSKKSDVLAPSLRDIPWLKFLKTKEVWAIMIAQFCYSYGFYVLLGWLPSFFTQKYGLDIFGAGAFTMIPYVVQGICGILAGIAADFLINRVGISKIIVRKSFESVGMFGGAIFLLLAGFMATTALEGAIYVTVGISICAITGAGHSVSQLDIAPRYAGVIFGIGNTVGAIPGIIGLQLTGWILDVSGDWRIVFGVAAGFYVLGGISWLILSGAEVVLD